LILGEWPAEKVSAIKKKAHRSPLGGGGGGGGVGGGGGGVGGGGEDPRGMGLRLRGEELLERRDAGASLKSSEEF